jgi:glycosyltransferase involved in cell wall biosynthesis
VTVVSVVIPVRDGARYLGPAIESVLAQDGVDVDVVVVDDGSTDASAAVARAYAPEVRLLDSDGAGPAAARNAGVRAARGTHVAFLDADDLMAARSLASRLAAGSAASPPDLVWGRLRCFVSPELSAGEAARIVCPGEPLPARVAGGLLLRRPTFDAVGPLPTHLRAGEFIAWAGRAYELGLTEVDVPDVVLHRRLHRTNLGRVDRAARGDYARLLKEMLDRRRRAGELSA